jgi:NADPH:quinone reductase-like Zn-dependent oxidoreductase
LISSRLEVLSSLYRPRAGGFVANSFAVKGCCHEGCRVPRVDVHEELGVRWIGSRRSPQRLAELAALAVDGRLTVHIRRTLPLARAAEAHRELETGHGRGKIVLIAG